MKATITKLTNFDYPLTKTEWAKKAGKYRVDHLFRILHDIMGYTVHISPVEANDVDMVVFDNGNLVLVIEVFNWNEDSSFLDRKRKDSIISNLTKYDTSRLLICSFVSNLKHYVNEILANGIDILEIGFQTISSWYYRWFKEHGCFYDKRPLNLKTTKIVKSLLEDYFAHTYVITLDNKRYFFKRNVNRGDIFPKKHLHFESSSRLSSEK